MTNNEKIYVLKSLLRHTISTLLDSPQNLSDRFLVRLEKLPKYILYIRARYVSQFSKLLLLIENVTSLYIILNTAAIFCDENNNKNDEFHFTCNSVNLSIVDFFSFKTNCSI